MEEVMNHSCFFLYLYLCRRTDIVDWHLRLQTGAMDLLVVDWSHRAARCCYSWR